MRTIRISFLVLVSLLVVVLSTPAQAQDKPKCTPATVVQSANGLKTSGNDKTDMDSLLKLAHDIDAMNRVCNGLGFSGKGPKLIGPFDLREGVYRTNLSTAGPFVAVLRVISGSCYAGELNETTLYTLNAGEGLNGAEALIVSNGCRLVIQPSKVIGNWTLDIIRLE